MWMLIICINVASAATPLVATVHVPHPAAQATAAVFRVADGAMVRTLWHRSETIAAGPLNVAWDATLDSHVHAGEEVDADEYEIRVQLSNVTYSWEGVVGNSGPATGPNVMSALGVIRSISVANGIVSPTPSSLAHVHLAAWHPPIHAAGHLSPIVPDLLLGG